MERGKINSECCFVRLKNDKLIYRCRECKKKQQQKNKTKNKRERPIEVLIRKFPSIYQYCNGNLNEFILLLRKGIYPYEDMDNWENFDETTIPSKKLSAAS